MCLVLLPCMMIIRVIVSRISDQGDHEYLAKYPILLLPLYILFRHIIPGY
jgi:hypothetical protein